MSLQLPKDFLDRMRDDLGDEFETFMASYEKPLTPSLRVNSLKTTPAAFEARYRNRFGLTPVPWEHAGFYYDESTRPGRSPLHEAGAYYIQEASAMIVGAVSGARPGERVLDLCAAPGGKSSHLLSKMHGQGLLVSNEIMPARAKILSRNMERMGATCSVVTNETPESLADRFPAFFDRIVVDAPCSGEGMFRKEEAAIPNWSPENVALCADRQRTILSAADRMLKPGGTLVYSTCTFSRDEDEENVSWFLTEHPSYREDDLPALLGDRLAAWHLSPGFNGKSLRVWPHRADGEGHFCARLVKGSAASADPASPAADLTSLAAELERESSAISRTGYGKNSLTSHGKSRIKKKGKQSDCGKRGGVDRERKQLLLAFWKETFRSSFPSEWAGRLLAFGDDIYLLPLELDLTGLKVLRPGLHLGTAKKGRFEPAHALALALLPEDAGIPENTKKETGALWLTVSSAAHTLALEADAPETLSYLRGESLPCPNEIRGWTLVLADGYPLGWVKAAGGVLKNHYPKGLRIQGG